MAVSPRFQRYAVSAPAGEILVPTVSLYHPRFPQDWHLCRSPTGFSADLGDGTIVTFLPAPFDVRLPGQSANGSQRLTLSVVNIGEEITNQIDLISDEMSSDVILEFREYFDLTGSAAPETGPLSLNMTEIEVTEGQINGNATDLPLFIGQVPNLFYTIDRFPGIVR